MSEWIEADALRLKEDKINIYVKHKDYAILLLETIKGLSLENKRLRVGGS